MNKPVVCFDFDGTLVDEQGHIHPRDVEILHREERVIFVPATGRPLHAVRRAFVQNGLFIDQPLPFPLLLQNGAMVYLPGERLHRQHTFSEEEQAKLLAAVHQQPGITPLLFGPDEVRTFEITDLVRQKARRFQLTVTPLDPETEQMTLTKLICFARSRTELESFLTEIEMLALERHFSLPTVLELNRAGIDKGQALAALLAKLDLAPVTIFAAGDGENDVPLLRMADRSFAPTDAPSAIKKLVDEAIDVRHSGLLTPMLKHLAL